MPKDQSTHCPSCSARFSRADIDGGRCMKCGSMIIALSNHPALNPLKRKLAKGGGK